MKRYHFTCILPVLLFVFSLSAMIPAGFMPGQNGQIEICAEGFTQTIPSQGDNDNRGHQNTELCDFATIHHENSIDHITSDIIIPPLQTLAFAQAQSLISQTPLHQKSRAPPVIV